MRLPIPGQEVVALIVAVSFAAGLNVYATVATLGLLARTGVVSLPAGLQMLGSWLVIGASAALFGVEFFADKVPAFDLIWNALHTFIRIPVGNPGPLIPQHDGSPAILPFGNEAFKFEIVERMIFGCTRKPANT